MIGFITTSEIASAVLDGIEQAMASRGYPNYWTPGAFPILTGDHAGMVFVPADETVLSTPLRGNPVQTPQDFPEFPTLIAALGGLDARVELDPIHITPPEEI